MLTLAFAPQTIAYGLSESKLICGNGYIRMRKIKQPMGYVGK